MSGSLTAPRRVSSRPPAMASAATDTSASGRRVRRPAHQPRAPPASAVRPVAPISDVDTDSSADWVSAREMNSKYEEPASVSGMPMTSSGSPSSSTRMRPALAVLDQLQERRPARC